ncbi:MAG: DUF2268 domain-containing protein [Bacteroidales bacterium]|nr:DUF2268 domain-containing protein [Bacteroidales bacterium]
MKNYIFRLLLCSVLSITMMMVVSCQRGNRAHKDGNIEILRFDKLLFDTPANQLQERLSKEYGTFSCPLLNVCPDDANYMNQVLGFVQDKVMNELYDTVSRHFDKLYWLEDELTGALDRAKEADADIDITKVIAFISGWLDYDHRVAADKHTILIAIDQYIIPYTEKYAYFGLPMYIVNLSDSAYLPVDCMSAVAKQYIEKPKGDLTLLDYMIAEGKALYFLEITLPQADETVRLRYTDDQLAWMRGNESNVWAYFIQGKLLYEKDFTKIHNFIDEAPKTNAFRDSAPRTAAYVGWQIVRQYAKKTHCDLKELFEETDAQKILKTSGYRP